RGVARHGGMDTLERRILRAERVAARVLHAEDLGFRLLPALVSALGDSVGCHYGLGHDGALWGHEPPGSPDFFEAYTTRFADADPLQAVKRRVNPRVGVTSSMVDRSSFRRSAVYNELYRPVGVEHHLALRLTRQRYGEPGSEAI